MQQQVEIAQQQTEPAEVLKIYGGGGCRKEINYLSLHVSSYLFLKKSEGAPSAPHASTGPGPKRKSDIQRSAFSTIIRSNPLGSEWRNESNTASMMAPSSTENRNSKTKLLFHSLLFSKVSQRENQRGKRIQKRSIIYSIENEMKCTSLLSKSITLNEF